MKLGRSCCKLQEQQSCSLMNEDKPNIDGKTSSKTYSSAWIKSNQEPNQEPSLVSSFFSKAYAYASLLVLEPLNPLVPTSLPNWDDFQTWHVQDVILDVSFRHRKRRGWGRRILHES